MMVSAGKLMDAPRIYRRESSPIVVKGPFRNVVNEALSARRTEPGPFACV